jgi:threonine/homoserine/homoserine lactone efflux protein
MSISFWITSLIVVLIPGTGVIYTVASGLTGGFKKSVWAALGCTFGIVPHIAASLLGLAALMNTFAEAYTVVKYLGVAYLLFLAWQLWNEKAAAFDRTAQPVRAWPTFRKALLMNVLNPKLTIFFLAFLPQFVGAGGAVVQMIELSGCFMALTLAVFLIYGALATVFRDRLLTRPRVMRAINRGFAGLLAVFGIQLAVSEK